MLLHQTSAIRCPGNKGGGKAESQLVTLYVIGTLLSILQIKRGLKQFDFISLLLSRSTALSASKTAEIASLKESLLINFRLKEKAGEAEVFTPQCPSIVGFEKLALLQVFQKNWCGFFLS